MKGYWSLLGALCFLLGGCGAFYDSGEHPASKANDGLESSSSSLFKGSATNQVISYFRNAGTYLKEEDCYVFSSATSAESGDSTDLLFSYFPFDDSFRIVGKVGKSSSSETDLTSGSASFSWGSYVSGMFFGDVEFAGGTGVLFSFYALAFASDQTIVSAEFSSKKNTAKLDAVSLEKESRACFDCFNLAVVYVDDLLVSASLPALS